MKRNRWIIASFLATALLPSLILADEIPSPQMAPSQTAVGQVAVSPDHGIAGQYGTWRVTYTVGEKGIAEGGGIRVQLPDAWHAGPRNSANSLQADDPQGNHYVRAVSDRSGVNVQTIVEASRDRTLIKHAKVSLDKRYERYVFVVRAYVAEGDLRKGDKLTVIYGDRSKGSVGYRAATVAVEDRPILLAVDASGDSRFRLHNHPPALTSRPGSAVGLQIHTPSQAGTGESHQAVISLVDAEDNAVHHAAVVDLTNASSSDADFPSTVRVPPRQGYATFSLTPNEPGILRLRGRARGLELEAESNPALVSKDPPKHRIYWGDLHSHTHYSWDGVGHHPFEYARYVSGLDFYSVTDHTMAPGGNGYPKGLGEATWDAYTDWAEAHHDPQAFVTLHAYECSFGNPYGHHNVFFKGKPGPMFTPQEITLPKLWAALEEGRALTIPHHTGKFPSGIDFSIHDPTFRRNFEIYSGHGLSETYAPDHPLAFEQSLFTSDSSSLKDPTYAQDVWSDGIQMSTIASSDDHRAQPGQPHYGLAAVRADTLTRDGIFDGLMARHTYGTTGSKIILKFALNDTPMGGLVDVSKEPKLNVRAIGTEKIAWVELLRNHPRTKKQSFEVIQRWEPYEAQFRGGYRDDTYRQGAVYYIRLKQVNKVRGRPVMAWSSPIWTAE